MGLRVGHRHNCESARAILPGHQRAARWNRQQLRMVARESGATASAAQRRHRAGQVKAPESLARGHEREHVFLVERGRRRGARQARGDVLQTRPRASASGAVLSVASRGGAGRAEKAGLQ